MTTGGDYQIAQQPLTDEALFKQKELLRDIVEEHMQWCQKLERQLLSHVSRLCPEQYYTALWAKDYQRVWP